MSKLDFELKQISSETLSDFYNAFTGEKTFLQSCEFGRFREMVGEKIFYLGIFERGNLVGTVLVQKISTKLKTFLHVPQGPLINDKYQVSNVELQIFWTWFLKEYKSLGKREKCDFVRIAPLLKPEESHILEEVSYCEAAIHLVNPEKTWLLDIAKPEDEILATMKKSTRYEVKKSLKTDTNFEVRKGTSEKDLDIFWQLHSETVKRQGFTPFPKIHTQKQLQAFGKKCQIISILHEEKPLASGIFIFDDRAGYYHQGASIFSKLPAAHAYMWQAILEAKTRGCREFNFWGVCGENESKHPWFGLSKFKRGFGGHEANFVHVHDAPLTWKYELTRLVEKWRRWKRGY